MICERSVTGLTWDPARCKGTSQEEGTLWLDCETDTVVSTLFSQLSLWDWGGHYLPKMQKNMVLLPFHRLIPASRGKRQWRVSCLPELTELPPKRYLHAESHVTLSVLQGSLHHALSAGSATQPTAASCHPLSCSLPGQGVVQLVSVCLNVYSALCLCWKRKDQSVSLKLKMEAVWLGTSSHSQSHVHVHVLTWTYSCPSSPPEPWSQFSENQAVPLGGHQRSGLPSKGSGLNRNCD